MSGKQTSDSIEEPEDSMRSSAAFEYVIGTLRGEDRRAFERQLREDATASLEVAFWEDRLSCLQPQEERAPAPDALEGILSGINKDRDLSPEPSKSHFSLKWFQWAMPTAAALALMFVLFGFYPRVEQNASPNTDYIAVLINESGKALVSALTVQDDKKMWFKWESADFTPETSRQLWAISKRDGEARPIVVLDDAKTNVIDLTTSTWRLVTDAAYLILTEEEVGGSAIDEPSDTILAKGVCVRFSASEKTI